MKNIFSIIITLFLIGCSKSKTVLICGDHICVNKDEAEQYFEENLSIEVKIIDKKENKDVDLIELNLRENMSGNKEIIAFEKKIKKKQLKVLSDDEIIGIKRNVKEKKENNKNAEKNVFQNETKNKISLKETNTKSKKDKLFTKNMNKKTIKLVDVCTILEKCSIDEISKYLLDDGRNKKFPDITTRQ